MKREQLHFMAYEELLDRLDEFVKYNGHVAKNRPEAIRFLLEEQLEVPEYDRTAYREYVRNSKVRGCKSILRKKGRKSIVIKIRKAMDKDQTYTLTEMAKLGEVGRRIAKDILERYTDDFTVIHEEGKKAFKIMKKPKKKKKKGKVKVKK